MRTDIAKGYTVRLGARDEGLEYRDEYDVYRFNVRPAGKTWTVLLPGSKGEYYVEHELSDEERDTILPRITTYLESRKYFGLFGRTDPVIFERKAPVPPEIAEARRRSIEWSLQKKRGR